MPKGKGKGRVTPGQFAADAARDLARQEERKRSGVKSHDATVTTRYKVSGAGTLTPDQVRNQVLDKVEESAAFEGGQPRIDYWLKQANHEKAEKRMRTANLALMPMLKNDFLNKKSYLEQAVRMGSVEAAIQQSDLVKSLVEVKFYDACKPNNLTLGDVDYDLSVPKYALAMRLKPLFFVYYTESMPAELVQSITVKEADTERARVMHKMKDIFTEYYDLPGIGMQGIKVALDYFDLDSADRNKIAKELLPLTMRTIEGGLVVGRPQD